MSHLTKQMKLEVVSYLLSYSKGLIEDDRSCPELVKAHSSGKVTSGAIEEFIEEFKAQALQTLEETSECEECGEPNASHVRIGPNGVQRLCDDCS